MQPSSGRTWQDASHLTSEEEQDVSFRLSQVDLHHRDERRIHVVALRRLGVEHLHASTYVSTCRPHQYELVSCCKTQVLTLRMMADNDLQPQHRCAWNLCLSHLHRIRAAGDSEDGAVEEVVAELLGVQRRARDDELQVLALLDHPLDQANGRVDTDPGPYPIPQSILN